MSNHITWFCRNSASVSLFATFSHKTLIANDFSSSQLFQKRSKISDCTFWNFSYKRKISFLLILCTRKRYLSMIENYIKRNDVIWYELDCLALTEIDSLLSSLFWDSLINSHRSLSLISSHKSRSLINSHRSSRRNAFAENVAI